MVPAGPLVEFAVGELVAGCGLDDCGRRGGGSIVRGAAGDGRSGERLRARPDPGVVRRSLHVAGDVREHFLVVLELFPCSAGAETLD